PAVLAKAVEQHPTDARLLLAAAEVALQDGRAEDAEAFASRGFRELMGLLKQCQEASAGATSAGSPP
ncbi:MAG: hypothetical protein IT380_27275, partial [Myxococcales bacterium]|nr:hypothetical protein [Myxococcales bacterium]